MWKEKTETEIDTGGMRNDMQVLRKPAETRRDCMQKMQETAGQYGTDGKIQ